jgi:ATP-dependent Zn protease
MLLSFHMLLQVREFIDGAYQRTLTLLREKKDFVEAMAQVCLAHRASRGIKP